MAFGDLVGTIKTGYVEEQSGEHQLTLDANAVEGNLVVLIHFTGAVASNPGAGMTEAVDLADGVNTDEGAIYYRVAGAAEGGTFGATPSATDESCVILFEIEGPFAASPLDKTATDGPNATEEDPQTTGTTAATAQNDEVAIGMVCARHSGNTICPTTWSNSFVASGCIQGNYKALAAARKVLTTTGTVETAGNYDYTPTGGNTMGMIATFKKEAAEAAFGPTVLIKPASAAP